MNPDTMRKFGPFVVDACGNVSMRREGRRNKPVVTMTGIGPQLHRMRLPGPSLPDLARALSSARDRMGSGHD